MRRTPVLVFFSFIFCTIANGQYLSRNVLCVAGSTYTSSQVSLSYTLGETVGDLFSNDLSSTYLTAGFSQPDQSIQEILESNDYINPNFTVYPNPAYQSSTIKLTFRSLPVGKYSISVFDASGKLCLKREHLHYSPSNFAYQEFSTSGLAHGVYYFRIIGDDGFKSTVSFIN